MNQVASLGTACGPSLKRNSVLRGLDASVMDLGGSQGVGGAPPKVIDGLEGFDLFSIFRRLDDRPSVRCEGVLGRR